MVKLQKHPRQMPTPDSSPRTPDSGHKTPERSSRSLETPTRIPDHSRRRNRHTESPEAPMQQDEYYRELTAAENHQPKSLSSLERAGTPNRLSPPRSPPSALTTKKPSWWTKLGAAPSLTPTQKNVLAMSKAQYLAHIRATHPADKLLVGAAVFRAEDHHASTRPLVLLLRRHESDVRFPGMLELPGGRVDDEDWSISDALAREVGRLTGLRVVRVLGMLSEMRWTDERIWLDGSGVETCSRKVYLQLNWTVLVENTGEEVVVVEGHDDYSWASWNTLDVLSLTRDMRELAKEALEWAGRRLS